MIRRTDLLAGFLSAMFFVIVGSVASADDFEPPPWDRADPFAITAEWEFFTDDNPIAPDGLLTNVGVKGSGSISTSAFISSDSGFVWLPGDGDGEWLIGGGVSGAGIHFELDNVIDIEPVKRIWMQVTHSSGAILGVDPLGAFNVAATGSVPGPVTVIPFDPTHTVFTWDMFPNPPWEGFDLLNLGGSSVDIDQVVIDTISVPEPSTLALAAFAFVGLAAFGWRRRTR